MAIPVGTKAPDFSLKSKQTSGLVDVRLSNNFGKKNTVLNADVIAVSVDSPFSQEAWAQKEKIGITLASDLNKKVAEAYGTLLPDLLGLGAVSARAAFVIDRKGAIQYSEQTPTPKDLPNFNAIQETLAK